MARLDHPFQRFSHSGCHRTRSVAGDRDLFQELENSTILCHTHTRVVHAMAAVMVGRRLKSIVLNFDSSGVTGSTGKGKGLGVIIKTMAGYPGPALMGLLIAYLISIDKVNLALLVLASTSLLLLFVRNLFGIVSIVTWNALVIGTLWLDNSTLSLVVASVCSAILMIGSVKATLELRARGDKNDGTVSDSDALGQATFISSSVWTVFFIAVCMTSTVAGSALLIL